VLSGTTDRPPAGAYYPHLTSGGSVSPRALSAPPGAVTVTSPPGCTTTLVGGVSYRQCGTTYYKRVGSGYRVVVF
jgi:hypothetical protein